MKHTTFLRLKSLAARAGCGCYGCTEGRQPGHFACSYPDPVLVELEERGLARRAYIDGAWRWRLDYTNIREHDAQKLIAALEGEIANRRMPWDA